MFENIKTEKKVKRHVNGRLREYFVITVPGFENVCQKELKKAGFIKNTIKIFKGGISFEGKFIDCLKANLYLRIANRILMRICSFKATNFRQLEKKIRKISWMLFLPKNAEIDIRVSSNHSRLYHKAAISDHIRKNIQNDFALSERNTITPSQTIFVRIIDDQVTISLDSTGNPLYKRGLKQGISSNAPIRETTASALFSIMQLDTNIPLIDPMCGSGTFSLEAAMQTKNIPPGFMRNFAFMKWPAFRKNQWIFLKESSLKKIKRFKKPLIYASDKNITNCKILQKKISTFGLKDIVKVSSQNFFNLNPSSFTKGPGTIIINPPYGIRMNSKESSKKLFNKICLHLKKFTQWNIGLIAPPKYSPNKIPLRLKKHPIINGGLKVNFFFGKII